MSLQSTAPDPIPDETVRVARAAFPKGNRYLRLRDTLGTVFTDAPFADLFALRGQPALPPWRLALVTVFQFLEELSDRQAAEAVRSRIDWKYALSLSLTDAGFDYSVLTEFRARLLAGNAEQRLFDTLLDLCATHGYLRARGQQRTDATHVLGVLRVLNRLELVGETLRAALTAVAQAEPAWLASHGDAAWADRYGHRVENYRLPKGEAARTAYALQVGADGLAFGDAVTAADAPTALRGLPAVAVLCQVWRQQYALLEGVVQLRAATDQPPSAQLIRSPYAAEARLAVKRDTAWIGYKLHLTETCDEAPHLLTAVTTTAATTADSAQLDQIQAQLAATARLPQAQYVDSGYVSGDTLAASAARGVTLVGPPLGDQRWQAQRRAGYAQADFRIDWEAQLAHCPQGQTSVHWYPYRRGDKQRIKVVFGQAACAACPLRGQCTQSATRPRSLTLQSQAAYAALQAARQVAQEPTFATRYARRAGIEGTLSQGVRGFGLRHARYRGQAKTYLQHLASASAMNLVRLDAWFTQVPLAGTRASPLRLLRPAA